MNRIILYKNVSFIHISERSNGATHVAIKFTIVARVRILQAVDESLHEPEFVQILVFDPLVDRSAG